MMNDRRVCGRASLLMCSMGFAGVSALCDSAALAQEDSSAPADNVLQEIVVTAERRQQSLQEVPISATVLSAADLSAKGVTSVSALQQVAPSVAINTNNRSTFINIRGVGIGQATPTSTPGVAFYIDGQLIPHEYFISQAFYDIGSVEVLRGPQGTLTGQNSTGGAMYLRTPGPDFNKTTGYLDLSGENYSHYRAVGALNVGFNDKIALRVAAVHDSIDSFTNNIGPSGREPGKGSLNAARANLELRTADDVLTVNLRGESFDFTSDNIALKRRNDTVARDPFVIEQDARTFANQTGYRVSGEVHYQFLPRAQLRVLSSWQDGRVFDQTDGDLTATAPPNTGAGGGRVSRARTAFLTWVNEINLLSTGNGPFQWVVGAFAMRDDVPLNFYRDTAHTTDFLSPTTTIVTSVTKNKSHSGFGQVNWFVTPRIELVGGARYSWDQQVFERTDVNNVVFSPAYLGPEQRSSELTGKVGINYHFDSGPLVYATASKGYKAGGVNLVPGSPNFSPETNRVYELGTKSEWFGHRLRINADIFHSNYQDIQFLSQVGGFPTTQNALAATSNGAELELTGQFGGLGLNLGAGYLDAKFSETACISNTDVPGTDPGCPTSLRVVPDGTVLPFSPKWTLNAGVQYEIKMGHERSLIPRLQWAHLSSQYATPFPSVVSLVPAHELVDARLTLLLGSRYTLEGFVTNLTDGHYISSQVQASSNSAAGIIYGAPRQYGARFVTSFGE
jgi:iron complex outermembrane receptor protein